MFFSKRSALKFSILVAILSFTGAHAATHIWQGPANGNWSTAANWMGGAPTTGELGGTIVQFGANTTSNQDLAGLTVDQIHFTGTGNTINATTSLGISGSVFTVNIQDDAGGNLLSASLSLVLKNAAGEAAVTTGTLTIAGNMSGSVGFIHSGPAALTITSASNTFTGTMSVSNGTLNLNSNGLNTAVPGNLTIGDSVGAASTAIVRLQQSAEIANTSTVTINSDGLFDLNGFSQGITSLINNNGSATLGAGTLSVSGNINFTSGTLTATTGSLNLGGNITATSIGSMGALITTNIALNATRTITVNAGTASPELTITGQISNGGAASGLLKNGTGTLDLLSATGNTYTGTTTVDKGTLEMNATSGAIIPAALVIGNGVDPAGSAIVREKLQTNDISSTAAVTINASGVLDMNNETDTIGALSGSGSIALQTASSLTVNSDNSTSSFAGSVSGTGGFFTKGGTGMLTLTGSNPFSGTTRVNAGILALNSNGFNSAVQGPVTIGTGFGVANSAVVKLLQSAEIVTTSTVTVKADGLLDLNSFSQTVGPITNTGGNIQIGAGNLITGALTLNGGLISATTGQLFLQGDITATAAGTGAQITAPIAINATRTITVNPGAVQPELTINGVISDSGSNSGLTKKGAGTLLLKAGANNTFTGVTTVDKGFVQLNNTVGHTLAGPIVIGNSVDPANSATLQELNIFDIPATSSMTINPSGKFDLNGQSDTLAALSGTGSVMLGSGSLSFGADNSSQSYGGTISGTGGVTKIGTGTQMFGGNNTYTGATNVVSGTLLVNGSQPGSAVSVQAGATLGGTGTVGNTTLTGATLSPGTNGPGSLATGSLTLDATSTVVLDLGGSTPAGSDSIVASGTVTLNTCTLTLNTNPNFAGTAGTQLTLIRNNSANSIGGTFKSRPEGTIFSAGSQTVTLSYIGGSGKDVTLAFANIPPLLTGPVSANPPVPVASQPVVFSAPASDANLDPLTYAWTFGDGSNGSGANPTHAYAAAGNYTVSVTITDGHGGIVSGGLQLTVNIAPPPSFNSPPAAAPSPAGVGETITFSAVASDGNPGTLTYAWDFGDGTNGTGASVTHAYTTAGLYNATLVVTDGLGQMSNASIMAVVNAPLVGTGKDSDGDGYSDAFEIAVGTDPNNPNDSPVGGAATASVIQPLTLTKAAIKLAFNGSGKDSIMFSGTVPIPAGFNAANSQVLLDVGGVSKSFTLSANGSAKKGTDAFKLTFKATKGKVAAQTAKFSAAFTKGSFAATLAAVGLTGDKSVKSVARTVTFTLIFNATLLQKNQALTYSATMGKTGSAK